MNSRNNTERTPNNRKDRLLISFKIISRINLECMTQDERWQRQYEEMMTFMETNHRRPSKHRLEEHDMLNWFKSTKKQIAKGEIILISRNVIYDS